MLQSRRRADREEAKKAWSRGVSRQVLGATSKTKPPKRSYLNPELNPCAPAAPDELKYDGRMAARVTYFKRKSGQRG